MKEANFKETEIGKIPVDWEVDKVKDFASIKTGSRNTQDKIDQGKYPFFVRSQTVEKINSYCFDGEAVLTAGDGVGVGKVIHYINGKFDCHQRVYMMTNFEAKILPYYFYVYFNNNFLSRMMQMTAKSSVDSVRMDMISEMQIPLPPLSEQEKIAEVLSDTDLWIESTEALLAKKRQIKKGAMQKLLSPKEDWEVRKLGEIAEIYTGKRNNQDKLENGIYPFFVRSQNVEKINSYSFDGEAILIPGEGGIGTIFHYINGKFDFHQRVYKISSFQPNYFAKYIYWYFRKFFGNYAMQNSVKATVDSLRLPTFLEFEINFPPLKLQQEIAEILSSMDLEIESLENRLQKARQLKQGMMQDLLTGKVRLE